MDKEALKRELYEQQKLATLPPTKALLRLPKREMRRIQDAARLAKDRAEMLQRQLDEIEEREWSRGLVRKLRPIE